MECKFADLTIEQVSYLVSANIDRCIVTIEKMHEIAEVLDLYHQGEEELIAIRNSVVDTLGALTSKAIERGNFKLYEQLQANMSGIVATIDHIMIVC